MDIVTFNAAFTVLKILVAFKNSCHDFIGKLTRMENNETPNDIMVVPINPPVKAFNAIFSFIFAAFLDKFVTSLD